MRSLEVIFAVLSFVRGGFSADWTYADQAAWVGTPAATTGGWVCDGMRQSPIDIVTSNAVHDTNLNGGFVFASDLGANIASAELENKGYTMQMTDAAYTTSSMTISGADLPMSDYAFWQFHFHWGTTDDPGSEHTVNGKRYPAEVHFVFKSKSTGLTDPNSLAVLGFFIDKYDDNSFEHGGQWKNVIDAITAAASTEGTTQAFANTLSISDLIPMYQPDVIQRVFHYDGSLTTPPCLEVVNWYVFEQPIYLSTDQYDQFLLTTNAANQQAVNTYRDIQPLNGRTVYKTDMTGGVPIGRLSISAIAVVVFAMLF
ncbi:carbonic anhydrase 2-like [Symsagittifera roscoffensis]|uniref:carbonic anhydrase 2-like n=1 Tax=Symsagittifera roscoffensis TaxID=84072 RepID=UPI00307CC501